MEDASALHLQCILWKLLNSRDEESVTSGTCQWKPKTQSNSEPCEIKDIVIEKIKAPSNKKKRGSTPSFKISILTHEVHMTERPSQKRTF